MENNVNSLDGYTTALFEVFGIQPLLVKEPHLHHDHLTFTQVLNQGLQVMDSTAASMCKDNDIPIVVFNLNDPDNIVRAVQGEMVGTTVNNAEE